MKIRKFVLFAAILAAAPACHKQSPEEQTVSLIEDMGNAVQSAGSDCGKMADNLKSVVGKYDLKALKKFDEETKKDKAKSDALEKKYGPRLQKAMPKLMGIMACADDPKMKDLKAQLDGLM